MILIATDFSSNALHATRVGMHLARHTDSRVLLVHAYKPHSRAGMFISMDFYIRKAAEEDMLDLVSELEDGYLPYLEETRVMQGYPEEVILRLERTEQIGLVVVGTQGDSALREIFMGHTATTLVNKLQCPLLAVPAEAAITHPEGLIFAWDGGTLDREDCETLIVWAGKIKTGLQIVHFSRTDRDQPDEDVRAYFESRQIPVHILPGAIDPKEAIDQYTAAHPHSWLVLVKRQRGFFEPLFHDSMVRRQLFTTSAPLLII